MRRQNETRRCEGAGLAKASFLAGMPSEDTIHTVLVNKLQRRLGLTELHALTVLRLANLGPKGGRD